MLTSETFRSSESLRRLLNYLGEVHLLGTGRSLKEYMIGRDVMWASLRTTIRVSTPRFAFNRQTPAAA